MDKEQVFERVTEICKDVFDKEDLVLNAETTAADVDGWDSLTHLQLMSELEDEFEIKFSMGEVQSMANVGELIETIMKKLEA